MQSSILIKIKETQEAFFNELSSISDDFSLIELQNKYSGKNGILFLLTEEFKKCSLDEKKSIGGALVELKKILGEKLLLKKNELFLINSEFPDAALFDPALKKKQTMNGGLHPYTLSLELITNFFVSMGFHILEGHILTDAYSNFTSLNIPEGHSAREEHDTFWIDEANTLLLRTHTSNVQVREASKRVPPFGIFSPGIVYRNEATDMSHDFMFGQIEGMFFGETASISSLLYVLKKLFNVYFEKENLEIRARPGLFPFVEPGLEIDFECPFCLEGCSTCKYSRWIELGGAGMVHQFVKKEMGFSNEEKGWAFGMGLTRMVMLKYSINDIRKLHQSFLCV